MGQPTDGPPSQGASNEAIVMAIAAWSASLMRPILSLRRAFLPLLVVYFACGALGIIDVSRDMPDLQLPRHFAKHSSSAERGSEIRVCAWAIS